MLSRSINLSKTVRYFSTSSATLNEVVIVAVNRTPIGSIGGVLSSVTGPKLQSISIADALNRAGLKPTDVDEAIIGNVISSNLGQAPARQCAIGAGLPTSVVCTTVNKVCSSGMKAVMFGTQSIQLGHSRVVVAGGFESMSNVPYYTDKMRYGAKYGNVQLVDGLVRDGLSDAYDGSAMGVCGDVCATKHNITRQEQDAYAVESYKRAQASQKDGLFKDEIVPVPIPQKGGEPLLIKDDEEPTRAKFDKIPGLKPAFTKDGTITAANASKLNDGAATVILMSASLAKEKGLKPLAKIIGYADAEQAPVDFPTAPALAIPKALKNANISIKDVDYFEINEAFSVVPLANAKLLDIDLKKLNILGGAVAMGHPIGSSGARIIATLTNILHKKGGKYGVAAICNGGGGASAIVMYMWGFVREMHWNLALEFNPSHRGANNQLRMKIKTTNVNTTNNNNCTTSPTTQSLFAEIKYPDIRKRLNIRYNDEITSILLDHENFKVTSLINVLAERFQVDVAIRPLLRLKTVEDGGRRIISLQDNSTYHDQILVLFQSTIKELESEQSEQERIRKQQEILKAERLKFEEENTNYRSDSKFLQDSFQLIQLYKDHTSISDSYPYCLQFLLTLDTNIEYGYIFINDNLNYQNNGVELNDVRVYSPNCNEFADLVNGWIKDSIDSGSKDICSIINHTFEKFKQHFKPSQPYTSVNDINQIFPSNLKSLETISHSQFLLNIQKMIVNISDSLKLNYSKSSQVLYKNQWNMSKLKASIREGVTKAEVEQRLIDRTRFKQLTFGDNADEDCSICYCPFEDQKSVVQLACGHNFCYQCMSSYIIASVSDGNGSSSPISCMDRECNYVLDMVTIFNILLKDDIRSFAQLNTMIINDVALLSKSKWCPGTGNRTCTRLLFGADQRNNIPFVVCACGANLCLLCGANDPHWPSACVKSHTLDGEVEDFQWIFQNTTLCRKCTYPIERSGGCNHMVCQKCQHQLCYICGDDWAPRHYACIPSKDKALRFRSLLEKSESESYFSTVLFAQHNIRRSNPFGALFNNLYGLSYKVADKDKDLVLRATRVVMSIIKNKFVNASEKEDAFADLRLIIPHVYRIKKVSDELRHAKLKAAQANLQRPVDIIRSLVCRISLNDKPNELLDTMFVQRSFPEFRREVMDMVAGATQGKVVLSTSFRLYNRFGHLVKSWNDILYNDHLFITKDDTETFVQPIIQEQVEEEISQEQLVKKLKDIKLKSKREPNSNQSNQSNQSPSTSPTKQQQTQKKIDPMILVEASLLFADLYKLDDEQSYDLVSNIYHQSSIAIKSVDELINLVLAENIGKQFSRNVFADPESVESKAKEELTKLIVSADYTEFVENNIGHIEQCLIDCNFDVQLALPMILSDAQADECARLQQHYDDQDEDELDDYLEYVDELESNTKILYTRPNRKGAADFW
ncbi:RING zinc finger-containing protein [Cavenderia fasciculata]|uniref:RING zinc finger-containing protein n=1 Tax=Cavenderia fasciculata TaxID=261658 RepID=F4PMV0_CACFS|nr:RING zinc finger-containing protein [Cavenderia fasciculata]EGG23694.1 RING zinc finger-containing protein [Cavenderia fasciculata]|eukprot:XP_004361545.1 RING zinc finger-containing protein [Cavenderia fasciculata]